MSQEQTVDPAYVKRFNEGYLMAKHEPELTQQLLASVKDIETKGFKEGIEQFLHEKEKDITPSWLKADRTLSRDDQAKDKETDIDMDKD